MKSTTDTFDRLRKDSLHLTSKALIRPLFNCKLTFPGQSQNIMTSAFFLNHVTALDAKHKDIVLLLLANFLKSILVCSSVFIGYLLLQAAIDYSMTCSLIKW